MACPLGWDELDPARPPNYWTIENLTQRPLDHDPWADFDASRGVLTEAMRRELERS